MPLFKAPPIDAPREGVVTNATAVPFTNAEPLVAPAKLRFFDSGIYGNFVVPLSSREHQRLSADLLQSDGREIDAGLEVESRRT